MSNFLFVFKSVCISLNPSLFNKERYLYCLIAMIFLLSEPWGEGAALVRLVLDVEAAATVHELNLQSKHSILCFFVFFLIAKLSLYITMSVGCYPLGCLRIFVPKKHLSYLDFIILK